MANIFSKIHFTHSKGKKWISVIAAVLLLGFVCANLLFSSESLWLDVLKIVVSGLLIAVITFVNLIDFTLKEKWDRLFSILLFLSSPVLLLLIVECLCFSHAMNIIWNSPLDFLLNVLFYLCIYTLLYVLSNRFRFSILFGNIFFWLLAIINHFTLLYRGTPILPWDLYSAGTAINVMDGYKLTFDFISVLMTLLVVFLCVITLKIKFVNRSLKTNLIGKAVGLSLIAAFCITFYSSLIYSESYQDIDNLWNQTSASKQHGLILNLAINAQYIAISPPHGYSEEKVTEIIEENTPETSDTKETENVKPNIIAIMNESFADFNRIREVEVSEDYMPFVRSMEENTIKGYLLVSAFGAGTSNTEFEFLTGNSMAFLPAGSIAYQQYIQEETQSLVSTLNNQGYTSVAVHPYSPTGWNRTKVYPYLGFANFLSIDDFENPKLIRHLISDTSSYDKLIELYEQKDPGDPLFLFNVTMQNHGGYDTAYENFQESIQLNEPAGYPEAQRFISLMKESDQAVEQLISYFSNQEEPTIIVLFGDHYPNVEKEFYSELYGNELDNLSLEDLQKQYSVPFFIWANYDIEEEYIDLISANYLSSLLLKTAGLKLSPYQEFLYQLQQSIPAMNINGYMDQEQNFHTYQTETDFTEFLTEYQILQYNNLFDKKHKQGDIFTLPEFE